LIAFHTDGSPLGINDIVLDQRTWPAIQSECRISTLCQAIILLRYETEKICAGNTTDQLFATSCATELIDNALALLPEAAGFEVTASGFDALQNRAHAAAADPDEPDQQCRFTLPVPADNERAMDRS